MLNDKRQENCYNTKIEKDVTRHIKSVFCNIFLFYLQRLHFNVYYPVKNNVLTKWPITKETKATPKLINTISKKRRLKARFLATEM
jgi:hypothetical protein